MNFPSCKNFLRYFFRERLFFIDAAEDDVKKDKLYTL